MEEREREIRRGKVRERRQTEGKEGGKTLNNEGKVIRVREK